MVDIDDPTMQSPAFRRRSAELGAYIAGQQSVKTLRQTDMPNPPWPAWTTRWSAT